MAYERDDADRLSCFFLCLPPHPLLSSALLLLCVHACVSFCGCANQHHAAWKHCADKRGGGIQAIVIIMGRTSELASLTTTGYVMVMSLRTS